MYIKAEMVNIYRTYLPWRYKSGIHSEGQIKLE
jgi:hypothetical protein